MLTNRGRFQPGEGPGRGLLRDCTTGCGTDASFYSTNNQLTYSFYNDKSGVNEISRSRSTINGTLLNKKIH